MYWNMDDTLTDSNYYSNNGSMVDDRKKGRNFAGCYYPLKEINPVLVKRLK